MRHEYAVTPIDVIARRTRLAFLNARSALDVLPHIVDIMAGEFGWSYAERQRQLLATVKFLGTMGLTPAFMATANIPDPLPRGWAEKAVAGAWRATAGAVGFVLRRNAAPETMENFGPGRSKFEAGEVAALRGVFHGRAVGGKDGQDRVKSGEVLEVLKAIPSYAEATKKDLEYVLKEAGLDGQEDLDLDEFIEVRGCFYGLLSAG